MRDTFVAVLTELARMNSRIMLITGDLGFGVLNTFAEALPGQYLNAGVAEQSMTGVAVGMALEGHKVFTYSIANFPTLRALEQLRNDAAYHDADVKVVAIGGGFSYGPLGMSHHATEDLAILRALPQIRVFSPGCLYEVREITRALGDLPGTCYLRLDKASAGDTQRAGELFKLGAMRQLTEGTDAALLATGGIVKVALQAERRLRERGVGLSVFSVHCLDEIVEKDLLTRYRALFTLEEHVVQGGLGGLVAETCLESGARPEIFHRFGLRGGYSSIVGSQDYLRKRHGLDAESIEAEIARLLHR